jgi:hypothetical protein
VSESLLIFAKKHTMTDANKKQANDQLNDRCCKTPLSDLKRDALEQYDRAATHINHWNSFIYNAIKAFNPDRQATYNAINSERDYQDTLVGDPSHPEMVDIGLGDTMVAIQYNIDKAIEEWYREGAPYPRAMNYMRKVAALAVRAGEKFGMPERVLINQDSCNKVAVENDCVQKEFKPSVCVKQPEYKCLKIVTPEQKNTNQALDELINICYEQIRQLLGREWGMAAMFDENQFVKFAKIAIENNISLTVDADIRPDVTQQILARIEVIKTLEAKKF